MVLYAQMASVMPHLYAQLTTKYLDIFKYTQVWKILDMYK